MSNAPEQQVTPPATLDIPTTARAAGYDALMQARGEGRELPQGYAAALDAAAPGIVAAELRRMADLVNHTEAGFSGGPISGPDAAYALRARANELDGGV